jgi:fibro-slime domain-containing protein
MALARVHIAALFLAPLAWACSGKAESIQLGNAVGGGSPGSSGAVMSGSGGHGGAGNSGAGGSLTVGVGTGSGGDGGSGGDPLCGTKLTGAVRDFHVAHPDFEKFLGTDKGIVTNTLGADKKPVYAGNPTTPTTTGKANFDQWYRDVMGVNMNIPFTIQLSDMGGGIYGYDNQLFFPIDNLGFGNEGNGHNFHFTFELHTAFIYKGFEVFEFIGDDDVFVYINGHLAVNLGGVHGADTGSIDLKANEAMLGLKLNQVASLDLFFAERHTVDSHFKVQTTIGSFVDCGGGGPK